MAGWLDGGCAGGPTGAAAGVRSGVNGVSPVTPSSHLREDGPAALKRPDTLVMFWGLCWRYDRPRGVLAVQGFLGQDEEAPGRIVGATGTVPGTTRDALDAPFLETVMGQGPQFLTLAQGDGLAAHHPQISRVDQMPLYSCSSGRVRAAAESEVHGPLLGGNCCPHLLLTPPPISATVPPGSEHGCLRSPRVPPHSPTLQRSWKAE